MKDPIDESRKRIYFRTNVYSSHHSETVQEAGEISRLFIFRKKLQRGTDAFVAYCFRCETKVTAHTLLDSAKLLVTLGNEFDVEVMHTSDSIGHRWKLNRQEKATLLNHIRKSLFNK